MYVGNKKVVPVLKVAADGSIKYVKLVLPVIKGGGNYNTLDVVTDPSDAVCTLTYGGNSYITKRAVVPTGTVISYSITSPSHPEYGTETGTVTVNADKTLTCTGVTTTTETLRTQPALTENGTLGVSDFAVWASHYNDSSRDIWKAFDQNTQSTDYYLVGGSGTQYIPIIVKMYCSTPLKIINFNFENNFRSNSAASAGNIYGSNTDSNYTLLTSFTNTVQSADATWDVSLSGNTNYFNYYQIEYTEWNGSSYGRQLREVTITAYKLL